MNATDTTRRTRWLALYALCLGDLMIVLDTNIVNVALPSIQSDLSFSSEALAWVVNAYMLTFGGFLLLSGRLGDLYGNRRVLLGGVAAFTVASVACAFAPTAAFLVVGRAVQGLGGAAVSAVALALIMGLFTDPGERAKAMGVFGFVMSGGGAVGVLLGGVLTGLLTWHWIFLVNVPIGIAVWFLVTRLVADERPTETLRHAGRDRRRAGHRRADAGGVRRGRWQRGRLDLHPHPLHPRPRGRACWSRSSSARPASRTRSSRCGSSRCATSSISQVVGVLWAGAMFACFFLSALYLQGVLGYDALQVGLAYLPSCAVMAVMSLRVSDKLVMKYGVRPPLVAGLALVAASLALFAIAPVDGTYVVHVLPPMVLLGLGAGIAFNPVLLAAMGDVEPHEAGLASGVVNTSFMMGGALGLAVLVAISSSRTSSLVASGSSMPEALTGGYQVAFAAGAVMAALAAVIGGVFLRPQPMDAGADAHGAPVRAEPEACAA